MSRFSWRPSCLVSRLSWRHAALLLLFACRQSTFAARASCLAPWLALRPSWRCCDWSVARALVVMPRRVTVAATGTDAHRQISNVEWLIHGVLVNVWRADMRTPA